MTDTEQIRGAHKKAYETWLNASAAGIFLNIMRSHKYDEDVIAMMEGCIQEAFASGCVFAMQAAQAMATEKADA